MKRSLYVWDMMFSNLCEGLAEVESVLDDIRRVMKSKKVCPHESVIYESGLKVRFEHAYHHINWSWNCRAYEHERVVKCSWRDYHAWEKFPKEFTGLWLPPSKCLGRPRECWNGRINPGTLESTLAKAVKTGDALLLSTMKRLDPAECGSFRYSAERIKGVLPVDEEGYHKGICALLALLNVAWNTRKLTLERLAKGSQRSWRVWRCYPRQFVEFWPRKKGKE